MREFQVVAHTVGLTDWRTAQLVTLVCVTAERDPQVLDRVPVT
jgi:hypothetical protein